MTRVSNRLAAAGCILSVAFSAWLCPSVAAAQATPSARIGAAALISPSSAGSYYSASPTSAPSGLSRPTEVVELARSLRNDPALIYDYVRNNTRTEWTYGLSKGAMGVVVDRTGTSFDQASLMVELLRQAGFSNAAYKVGTISLSGAQFAEWTNITSAKAACQLLSSGGFPAVINGSSLADCSYDSGASISGIEIGHAWVSVTVGGTPYVLDPAYKAHTFKAGLDLAVAAQLTSGQALAQATSGIEAGNAGGFGYVRDLKGPQLTTTLQTYAANIQARIESDAPAGSVADIVGGQSIIRTEGLPGSQPYTLTASQTFAGALPDRYRTRLRVQISKLRQAGGATGLLDTNLFVDEIYGRKLVFDTNFDADSDLDGAMSFLGSLRLIDETGSGATLAAAGPLSDNPQWSRGTVTLSVTTPYASAPNQATAATGGYMNATFTRDVNFALPFVIVHGWGETGRRLVDKWGQRRDDALDPLPHPEGCETCTDYLSAKGNGRREQLAASWLAQSSRAANLNAAIGKSVYAQHYAIGVVSADAVVQGVNVATTGAPRIAYTVADTADRVDVETGFSVTSRTANVLDRRAAVHAIAAASEALEASVNAQVSDLPDTSSTSTRFEWGNKPPAAEDVASGGADARRFYDFTGATSAQVVALAKTEGQQITSGDGYHGTGEPVIGLFESDTRRNQLGAAVATYSTAGFRVIASEEAFLGPGQRAGAYNKISGVQYSHLLSKQRGGALIATRYLGDEPIEIAHVVVGPDGAAKGGGGGAQAGHQAQYDPSKAADVLKSRFVDRSSALGANLRDGSVAYSSPAKLSVGQGDFPYQLSAELIWRGGAMVDERFGPTLHTQPQTPWTTNWNNALTLSGSGLEAMGETDVRAMAGTLAAFVATQDVYRSAPTAQREVTGALIGAWWIRQLQGNIATVNVGASTRQFVRKADNSWFAPGPGAYATLTQSGQRTIVAERPSCLSSGIAYVATRGWSPAGMSFAVTNSGGDVQTFAFWRNDVKENFQVCARQQGFRLTGWAWPQGVNLSLTYASPAPGALAEELTSVSNNLGRRINFVQSGLGGFDNGLTGGDRRAVTVTTSGLQTVHTDPAGHQTAFETTYYGDQHRLAQVFAADNAGTPALRYTYDVLGRVREAYDRLAVSGGRNPYQFMIAEGLRGERIDPNGAAFSVLYDVDSQPFRFADELGRKTQAAYDGRRRVTGYTYPELDQEQFQYDGRNNMTRLTKLAKPGSAEAATPIVIEAGYDLAWNKPAWIRDALTGQTDFAYYAGGSGMSLMQSATRPSPTGAGGARPVYSFTYNGLGQLLTSTDPTNVQVANGYDGLGYLATTTLDPAGVNAVTTYANNALGDVTQIDGPRTDVADISRAFQDALRRTWLEVAPDPGNGRSVAAKTTFDPVGRVSQAERGYYASSAFSALQVTAYGYDAVGNKTRETSPVGVTQYSYDPMNRLTCTAVRMNVATYGSLPADACDHTSPSEDFGTDRISRNTYDAAGQLLSTIIGAGTEKEAVYATYTYSANGQKVSLTDANGNRSSMVYDGFDRLATLYFPSTTRGAGVHNASDYEQYTYDLNGNRKTYRKRGGGTIAYQYDPLNRVVRKTPTSGEVNYIYDLAGRPKDIWFTGLGQNILLGYDTAGRQVSEASYSRTLTWTLDKAGARTRLTWPGAGFYVDYVYDAAGRMKEIRENGATSGPGLLAQLSYGDLDQRTQVLRGNGTSATYAYADPAGRLTSLGQGANPGTAGSVQSMSYNPASQISTLNQTTGLYTWEGHPTSSADFTHDGLNRDARFVALTGGYDSDGLLRNDGARTFNYDRENRLTSAGWISSGAASSSLSYDALGRLRAVTVSGVSTGFLYEGDRVIAEYPGSSSTASRRYVHGPGVDEPLVWLEGSGTSDRRWLHADRQGSIIAWSDGAGAVTRYRYGPYGEPDSWGGSRFRYTGQMMLPEAQLYHYKARAYDPMLGRFLQPDPIGYQADMNLYAYVKGDPTNLTDPDGRNPFAGAAAGCAATGPACPVGAGIGAAVGTVAVGAAACGASAACTGAIATAVDSVRDFIGGILENRGKNNTAPDDRAEGPHSVRKPPAGEGPIRGHTQYEPNPKNPSGFDEKKRTDVVGRPHVNKETGQPVPTPHTTGKDVPGGVRPATPDELPASKKR